MKTPTRLTLLALAAALCATGCHRKPAPGAGGPDPRQRIQPVEVTPVERRDLRYVLRVAGSLAANESAEIRPEISGKVEKIFFGEGDRLKAGAPLLQIDDRELRAQLADSEARMSLSEQNLNRTRGLSASRVVSQSELDAAQAEHDRAKAELELLRVRLERTTLVAPFDGKVGARTISPGDFVTPQTVVTRLDDTSRLKVEFAVPERYAGKVRPGGALQVRAGAGAGGTSEPVSGEVYFVSPNIERETRSVAVKGYVDNAGATLKPGMFANVELVLEERKGVLAVPEGALLTTAEGSVVIAVAGGKGEETAQFVPVRPGLRAEGVVEVEPVGPPLEEGQRVVASGVGGLILFPGARLEPREPKPPLQKTRS